jgi:hypothetical protein
MPEPWRVDDRDASHVAKDQEIGIGADDAIAPLRMI